jgi:hypothetical protein
MVAVGHHALTGVYAYVQLPVCQLACRSVMQMNAMWMGDQVEVG